MVDRGPWPSGVPRRGSRWDTPMAWDTAGRTPFTWFYSVYLNPIQPIINDCTSKSIQYPSWDSCR